MSHALPLNTGKNGPGKKEILPLVTQGNVRSANIAWQMASFLNV